MAKCKWKPPEEAEGEETQCDHPHFREGYCIFHLPLEFKQKDSKICDLFFETLKQATKGDSKSTWNFKGFIFPSNFDYFQNRSLGRQWSSFNTINFKWSKWGENASLKHCKFPNGVIFDGSEFFGNTDFGYVSFGCKANFNEVCFHGPVCFDQIKGFQENTRVEQGSPKQTQVALVGGPYEATIPWIIFNKTKFKDRVFFQRTDLSYARFQRVDLSNTSFRDATIRETKFISCRWGDGDENNRNYHRKKRHIFSLRRRRILFDELILRKKTYWTTTPQRIQKEPIDEINISEHADISFGDIRVLALQLKQTMEDSKDPIAAGDFHFAVMEMKRLKAIHAWKNSREYYRGFRAGTLWLYKMVNGYGERYGRTMMWIVWLVALSTAAYMLFCKFVPADAGCDAERVTSFWDFLMYACQNVLPLKFTQMYIKPCCQLGRWLSFMETFLGTTLFTFMVLALRRRFKR